MYANWTSHSARWSTFAPQSAPFASSAITALRLLGLDRRRYLAAPVGPANRADPVRKARRVALGARLKARRGDRVLRTPLVGARVRLLLLGDRHGAVRIA